LLGGLEPTGAPSLESRMSGSYGIRTLHLHLHLQRTDSQLSSDTGTATEILVAPTYLPVHRQQLWLFWYRRATTALSGAAAPFLEVTKIHQRRAT